MIPPPEVGVYQVEGNLTASATRAARTAVSKPETDGVLENMWRQAFRVQHDYDVIIGFSYDWLPFYLTPFFHTPVAHWVTICSSIDEVDGIIAKRWRAGELKLAMYTRAQAETYAFLQREPIHLLYGGVDTATFRFNPQPENRLCWAARISPEKGLEDAIAAADALQMPLDICGKIQDGQYWQALMRDAGPLVTYHGFLSPADLQRRFAGASVTLVTPHWIEAFGNTVIESMACGTPVVAYDRGGPAEIVEHGRSGVLVPREQGAQGLAEGVRAAIHLDRQAVRARAAQFSFARMADRFEAWLECG